MFVITVLGKQLPCLFDSSITDQAKLHGAASDVVEMANRINAGQWSQAQTNAFLGTDRIVFFETVMWHGAAMTRPFMDQEAATFYWEIDEFLTDGVDGPRRPTFFFHDCWHLAQYRKLGGPAKNLTDEVDREVDATDRQIECATVLGCDQPFLDYLTAYRNDRAAIEARIGAGYEPGAKKQDCCKVALAPKSKKPKRRWPFG